MRTACFSYLFIFSAFAFHLIQKQEVGIYSVWKSGKMQVCSFTAKVIQMKLHVMMWAVFVFAKQVHFDCARLTFFMGTKMLPIYLARLNLPDS